MVCRSLNSFRAHHTACGCDGRTVVNGQRTIADQRNRFWRGAHDMAARKRRAEGMRLCLQVGTVTPFEFTDCKHCTLGLRITVQLQFVVTMLTHLTLPHRDCSSTSAAGSHLDERCRPSGRSALCLPYLQRLWLRLSRHRPPLRCSVAARAVVACVAAITAATIAAFAADRAMSLAANTAEAAAAAAAATAAVLFAAKPAAAASRIHEAHEALHVQPLLHGSQHVRLRKLHTMDKTA